MATERRGLQDYTGGAAHVTAMPGGTTVIREADAVSSAVTMDFGTKKIKAVRLQVAEEALAVAGTDIGTLALVVDPPSDAYRDLALTAGSSLTIDSQRIQLKAKGPDLEMVFESPVRYLGMKRDIGANALRVTAIGVEA